MLLAEFDMGALKSDWEYPRAVDFFGVVRAATENAFMCVHLKDAEGWKTKRCVEAA